MSIQKANKNEVRKEIAALIDSIKLQSDRIGTQREIPQSELDVILHRIEELHRQTVVWCYLNVLPEEVEVSLVTVPPIVLLQPAPQVPTVQVPIPVVEPPAPVVEVKIPESVAQPEVIQEKKVETVAPKPTTRKDVRLFIGFNEKLMYIRQLFAGDNAGYEETLNQINGMESIESTEAFLSVVAGEYKWNYDHEPVAIFIQTVKRRFN